MTIEVWQQTVSALKSSSVERDNGLMVKAFLRLKMQGQDELQWFSGLAGSNYRTQWGYDRVMSMEDNFSGGFMASLNGLQ